MHPSATHNATLHCTACITQSSAVCLSSQLGDRNLTSILLTLNSFLALTAKFSPSYDRGWLGVQNQWSYLSTTKLALVSISLTCHNNNNKTDDNNKPERNNNFNESWGTPLNGDSTADKVCMGAGNIWRRQLSSPLLTRLTLVNCEREKKKKNYCWLFVSLLNV